MKTNYSKESRIRCETCKHGKNGGWFTGYAWVCTEDGTEIPPSGTRAGPGIGESTIVDYEQYKLMREWIKDHGVERTACCDDYAPNTQTK